MTNRIEQLRSESGHMTQAEPAEKIGVTRQTVIAVEGGTYPPSLEMAFEIAHVPGRPLDEVFGYETDPAER